MRRRDFIGAIFAAALARPFGAAAQPSAKVWRIGHLLPSTPTPEQAEVFARELERRLAEFGYVQGRNIVLVNRFAGPRTDQIEEAVISLVPQVDLLVVWGNGGPEPRADTPAPAPLPCSAASPTWSAILSAPALPRAAAGRKSEGSIWAVPRN